MEKFNLKELAILKSFLDYLVLNSKRREGYFSLPKYEMSEKDFDVLISARFNVSEEFWNRF